MSTCYFCKTVIDGNHRELTMCPCGLFGVDKADGYTRYVGSIPAEDLTETERQHYDEALQKLRSSSSARFPESSK